MLTIKDLSFKYGPAAVFNDFSATLPPGTSFVRGGDGRGKTTLIRLLAGELAPDAGYIQLNGSSLKSEAASYRKNIFWIDPRSEAFDQITALEFFESQRAAFPNFDYAWMEELIDGLDLRSHVGKKLYMLSTGSKRKVWIAAAFASGASLALLDMPFSAVDKTSSVFIVGLLQRAAGDASRTLVFADYEAPEGLAISSVIDLGD